MMVRQQAINCKPTALIFGEVYKKDNEWKFNAIGQGTKAKSVKEMCAAFK